MEKAYNYYHMKNIALPDADILKNVIDSVIPETHTLSPENYNLLLEKGYHQYESGYCILPDGTGFIAFNLNMPGITPEMFNWFFAWHPLDSDRYIAWHPEDHVSVAVDEEDRKQLLNCRIPFNERLWGINVLYREKTEDDVIHENIMSYHSPFECGFDECNSLNSDWTAVCANEGSICHFVRKTDDGSELRTRIWTGIDTTHAEKEHSLPGSLHPEEEIEIYIKKTAIHNITDFSNLASILPGLYSDYFRE